MPANKDTPITFSQISNKYREVRLHMRDAIEEMDTLIAIMKQYSGGASLSGLMFKMMDGGPSANCVRDTANVLKRLDKIRKEYAGVYLREFKSLDQKTLQNFTCQSIQDLFGGDLLSRLQETRSLMQVKMVATYKEYLNINKSLSASAIANLANDTVSDPAFCRYVDSSTTEDQVKEAQDDYRAMAEIARDANLASPDKASLLGCSTTSSESIVEVMFDWSANILHAQYPVSSKFCSDSLKVSGSTAAAGEAEKLAQLQARNEAKKRARWARVSAKITEDTAKWAATFGLSEGSQQQAFKDLVSQVQDLINQLDLISPSSADTYQGRLQSLISSNSAKTASAQTSVLTQLEALKGSLLQQISYAKNPPRPASSGGVDPGTMNNMAKANASNNKMEDHAAQVSYRPSSESSDSAQVARTRSGSAEAARSAPYGRVQSK